MKSFNLIFGALLLFIFLLTGIYLRYLFRNEHLSDLTVRMEIRANHVYILFASLLNILSYKVEFSNRINWIKIVERLFRSGLIISGVLFLIAFVTDHRNSITDRYVTFYAVLFSLIPIVAILINEIISYCRAQVSSDKSHF